MSRTSERLQTGHEELGLSVDLTAPAKARSAVRGWLTAHPRLDDVLLAVSELVNNVVVHSSLSPRQTLMLTMSQLDGRLRFEIGHPGSIYDPDEGHDPDSKSRGLAIVEAISDDWGIEAGASSIVEWFEIHDSSGSRGGSGQN